jgi:hypothetical protein
MFNNIIRYCDIIKHKMFVLSIAGYCTAEQYHRCFTPLHSIALHSNALHSIALHSNALHSNALHSNALHSNALHSNALHSLSHFTHL